MLASEILDQVKFLANIQDSMRYSDANLLLILSRAQRAVQRVIYNGNPSGNPFAAEAQGTLAPNEQYLDLPSNMLAPNSLISVAPLQGGRRLEPLRYRTARDLSDPYSYNVLANQIKINTEYRTISIWYSKIWDRLTDVGDTLEAPDCLEDYLIRWMIREIKDVDSDSDVSRSTSFTAREKQDILDLFSKTTNDILYPTISHVDNGIF